jgi:hypothetical protein
VITGGELPDRLAPLAFLVGSWGGAGVGGYPTIDDFRYRHQVEFSCSGRPVLTYTSRSWAVDDGRPLAAEAGFLRMADDGSVEAVLAHSSGLAEVYLGTAEDNRLELATDVVARSPSARDVRAERRLYGLVGGELMYAVDIAAVGQPLSPHLSARLQRQA